MTLDFAKPPLPFCKMGLMMPPSHGCRKAEVKSLCVVLSSGSGRKSSLKRFLMHLGKRDTHSPQSKESSSTNAGVLHPEEVLASCSLCVHFSAEVHALCFLCVHFFCNEAHSAQQILQGMPDPRKLKNHQAYDPCSVLRGQGRSSRMHLSSRCCPETPWLPS